ncbi:U3 small nucleolar RNA-associated protein 11 [Xylariaceae sp. FL0016]|nr:U3 small nucleolar RNA-associated protein 11 [Xylariaceae sp. FL0016]
MSSSMRNAVQRRNHKERGQLIERSRLGLLEKHKDYSTRARDYKKKQQTLKNLRAKAADRNEDEFYFGMLSRKGPSSWASKGKRWDGRVDGDRGSRVIDNDEARLLKTQDVGYVRTTRNVIAKEVRALEERIVEMGGSLEEEDGGDMDDDLDGLDGFDFGEAPKMAKPKKTVFADDVEEREERMLDAQADADEDEADDGVKGSGAERAEEKQQLLEKLKRRLESRRKRLHVLARAERGLEEQRAKMAKTATSGGTTKAGKQIKVRRRKR